MNTAVLAIGSNVGNRLSNLGHAVSELKKEGSIVQSSSVYETEPWGNRDQEAFYNQVVVMHTKHSPEKLMSAILETEKKMGRQRKQKWEPRRIDIDILFYNEQVVRAPDLTIPHPHLHERNFVLVPLAEIVPGFIHPLLHATVAQLLAGSTDASTVRKLKTALPR